MGTHAVQDERAGLLQVPAAALQQLLTLASGPQTQTEQLLHLSEAAAEPDSDPGFDARGINAGTAAAFPRSKQHCDLARVFTCAEAR